MKNNRFWGRRFCFLCVCVALVGCGDATVPSNNLLTFKHCAKHTTKAVPLAVNGAECATVAVAENPQDSHSRHINLHIKRWPAISAVPKPDPLFVIVGGPGQAASEVAGLLVKPLTNLRKKRDIIFVDQRGTGQSNPMQCDDDKTFNLLASSALMTQKSLAKIAACGKKFSQSAQFYTTDYAVDDLEQVRKALGYKKINLWGASYGTRVLLNYLKRYPQALRAVVMDGVAPIQIALPAYAARDAKRALTKVSQQCVALPECFAHYGKPQALARRVARELQKNPVAITIKNPLTAKPTPILLDREKFASFVRMALYDRWLSRLLPAVIYRASQKDYALLASLITQLNQSEPLKGIAQGMHLTILCNEDGKVKKRPHAEQFLGVDIAAKMQKVCAHWPSFNVPRRDYQPVTSQVPALLLSGARDPVTPPHWAMQVAKYLPNATSLVAPDAHHGVTRVGCGAQLVTDFIRARALTDTKAQCVNNIKPLKPYIAPSAVARAKALLND